MPMEDNLGRQIENIQVTAADLLSETKKVTDNTRQTAERVDVLNAIRESVSQLTQIVSGLPLNQLLHQASSWTNELAAIRQEIAKTKTETTNSGGGTRGSITSLASNFERFYKEAKSPNTLWFGVSKFGPTAMRQLEGLLLSNRKPGGAGDVEPALERAVLKATAITGGAGDAGGGTAMTSILSGIGNSIKNIGQFFTGVGMSFLSSLPQTFDLELGRAFAGLGAPLNDYVEQARAIAYRLEGYTRDNRGEEKKFLRAADEFTKGIDRTGVAAEKQRVLWLKTLQRGASYTTDMEMEAVRREATTDEKKLKLQAKLEQMVERNYKRQFEVQKAAEFAATQMGMDIDATHEMFMDWHQQLGFTAIEMGAISRNLSQISKTTGLTGKNLESALKNSESVMQSMRSLGTLDLTSSKSIQEMTASFQKYGVAEQGADFLKKLGSSAALQDERFALLAAKMAGNEFSGGFDQNLYKQIRSGRALGDIESRKAMGKNLEAEITGRFKTFGGAEIADIEKQLGKPIDLTNIEQAISMASDETQTRLNLLFKQIYGYEVMDLARINQGLQDSAKTYKEKVTDINEQLKLLAGQGITTGKRVEELNAQKLSMEQEVAMSGFEALNQELRNHPGDFAAAMQGVKGAMQKQFGEGSEAFFAGGNMDAAFDVLKKGLEAEATQVGTTLNEVLKDQGIKSVNGLKEMLSSSDADVQEAGMNMLNAVQQQIANTERVSQDPATWLRQQLDRIAGIIGEWIQPFRESLGEMGTAALVIGGFLTSISVASVALKGLVKLIWSVGSWAVGAGGAAAGGAAAGGAAAGGAAAGAAGAAAKTNWLSKIWGKVTGRGGSKAAAGAEGAAGKSVGFLSKAAGKLKGKGRIGAMIAGAAALVGGGMWLKNKLGGGDTEEAATAAAGGEPLPVYVVNWKDLCSGGGGTGTGFPMTEQVGANLEKTEPERELTAAESVIGTAANAAMYTTMGGALLSKLPGIAGTKVGGMISGAGATAGRLMGPLQGLMGAATGWAEAEEVGMSKATGAAFGALTGGAKTGSMFSELLGIKKGSNTDEKMGVIGSAAHGAMIAGPVGAAVAAGAEVGKILYMAHKEVDAMVEGLNKSAKFQADFNEKSLAATKQISDPKEKLAELERQLAGKQELLKGQTSNLEGTKAERSKMSNWNWFGLSPAAKALDATIESDSKQLEFTTKAIENLKTEIAAERNKISDSLDVAAKTLEVGAKETLPDNLKEKMYGTSNSDLLATAFELRKKPTTQAGTSNALDYTEDTEKPHISTSMFTSDDAETFLERQKYGSVSASGPVALLPSMDAIAEYLIKTQSDKLDQMIEHLAGIKANTDAVQNSAVQSPVPLSSVISRSRVRRAAAGAMKATWGLQPGAYATTDVISDGRNA